MSHVVQCFTLEGASRNVNPQAFNIAPYSGLWILNKKGMRLVKVFSSYVLKNRINFPVEIGVFPFTRNAALAS